MILYNKFSRQIFGTLLALTLSLALSSRAFALIDISLEAGQRTSTWTQDSESTNVPAQVLRAALHLDPIPLVPVSFGLGVYSETWNVSEAEQGLKNISSFSVVPEIVAWIPLGDLRPYARVGYSISSGYTGKAVVTVNGQPTDGSIALGGVGVHAGAGLEYNIPVVPLLSVLAGVEYANERVKLLKDEVAGVNISGAFKPITITSTAILVGAKIGF